MATTTQVIVDLTLLLAASALAGELANRLGQAALVGQLLVGVVLGPSLVGPLIGLSALPSELATIQLLATVFILFLAGLEVVPETIFRMGPANLLFGILAFVVPFVSTALVAKALFPGLPTFTLLFIALTLSITALPVMGIMLTEFGVLRAPIGRLLMNAALVNEIVAVSAFAVLDQLYVAPVSGGLAVAAAVLSVAVFLGAMLSIHMGIRALRNVHQWERIRREFARTWRSRSGGFALLMIFVLASALFSQYLGLTFVVGAFYAGLLVTEESAGRESHRSISTVFGTMSWGFFVPLFFAVVGIEMNLRLIANPEALLLLVLLFAVAFLSKAATGYGFGRALGWSDADATAIGYLVSSRGAVELAMAVILLQAGIFTTTIFTLVAAVGLLTTILAPVGAVRSWESDPKSREELYERMPVLRPGSARTRAFRRGTPFGPIPGPDPGPEASDGTVLGTPARPRGRDGASPPVPAPSLRP